MKLLLPLALVCLAGCATAKHTVIAPPPGPTLAEVQSLVQAHVGDEVIVSQINNSSTRYTLTADQIIALKNAGVSDSVLNALINTASKAPPEAATPVYYDYGYPYAYVDPWPWYSSWWGWGPYNSGGYYRGYYYGSGCYNGGPPHGNPPPHGNAPPHGNPPQHSSPPPHSSPPHASPPTGGGSHGVGSRSGGSSR